MYRAVIIYCLIAIGCAQTFMPTLVEDYLRQTKNIRQPNVQNHNTPSSSSYQESSTTPVSKPPTYSDTSSSNSTAMSSPINEETLFSSLKPYLYTLMSYSVHTGNYLLQILGVTFVSTSVLGLVCSYTSICNSVLLELAQERGFNVPPNQLNDIIYRIIDLFSNAHQKRNA